MTDFDRLEELFELRQEITEQKPHDGTEKNALLWGAAVMNDLKNADDPDAVLEEIIKHNEAELEVYRGMSDR